jgi:hypothetical protein
VLNLSVALVSPSSTGQHELEEALDYAARPTTCAMRYVLFTIIMTQFTLIVTRYKKQPLKSTEVMDTMMVNRGFDESKQYKIRPL